MTTHPRPTTAMIQALPVQPLAQKAGFTAPVNVVPMLIDRVFIPDGKHTVEESLSVFLRACAEQVKIAITDNKCWKRTRFYYPMAEIDDRFTPEEVTIYTQDNGEVLITSASIEAFVQL